MKSPEINNQLSLFPRPREPDVPQATRKWWSTYGYEPAVGQLTTLPTLSRRLTGGQTLYTVFETAYIHRVSDGYALVFMPEHWSGTWKCYDNTWLMLPLKDCGPVLRYGFDRSRFELERPNHALTEEVLCAFSDFLNKEMNKN